LVRHRIFPPSAEVASIMTVSKLSAARRPYGSPHLCHHHLETLFSQLKSSRKLVSHDRMAEVDVVVPPGSTAVVHHGQEVTKNIPAGVHKFSWNVSAPKL
jgi:hypothetical protein